MGSTSQAEVPCVGDKAGGSEEPTGSRDGSKVAIKPVGLSSTPKTQSVKGEEQFPQVVSSDLHILTVVCSHGCEHMHAHNK